MLLLGRQEEKKKGICLFHLINIYWSPVSQALSSALLGPK